MPDLTPYAEDATRGEACRRSARIDLEEADRLTPGPRRDKLIARAARWEAQAEEHDRIDVARRVLHGAGA